MPDPTRLIDPPATPLGPIPDQLKVLGDPRAANAWWDVMCAGATREQIARRAEWMAELIERDPDAALAEMRDCLPCPCVDSGWFEDCDGEPAILRECAELLGRSDGPCSIPAPQLHGLRIAQTVSTILRVCARTIDRTVIVTECAFCHRHLGTRTAEGNGEHFSVSSSFCDDCERAYIKDGSEAA